MVFHIGQRGQKHVNGVPRLPNGDDMSESARKRCANRSKSTPAAKRSRSEGERLRERRGEEATNPDNNGSKKGAQFKFPDAAPWGKERATEQQQRRQTRGKKRDGESLISWNNEKATKFQSASKVACKKL